VDEFQEGQVTDFVLRGELGDCTLADGSVINSRAVLISPIITLNCAGMRLINDGDDELVIDEVIAVLDLGGIRVCEFAGDSIDNFDLESYDCYPLP